MTSLKDWAERALALLPDDPEADPVELLPAVLSKPPEVLATGDLVIERGCHDYDTWRVDYPQWSADKETYGSLGLAILSALLHHQPPITIELTSPRSQITTLVVQPPPTRDLDTGLELAPRSLLYAVEAVERHPWTSRFLSPYDLPWFKLTNRSDDVVTEQQRSERDCIHGLGSALATARFAKLLLDISRPSSQTLEVALECEAGFRGVAPASAEVRLWLPGSIYWVHSS